MIGKARIILLFCVVATLMPFAQGCCRKTSDCKDKEPGCRYVYERRVDEVAPPIPNKLDHVMVLLSITGRPYIANSHCAALFCKVKQDKVVESCTISWMPASQRQHNWKNAVEDGINLDMPATLAWGKSVNAAIERHGPYYIKEDLYNRAKNQEDRLRTGSVKFKISASPASRQSGALNSIHAISDILCNGDQFDKFLVTGNNRGRDAAAILKAYFDKEGYIDGRYRNEGELLQPFCLQNVRRLD